MGFGRFCKSKGSLSNVAREKNGWSCCKCSLIDNVLSVAVVYHDEAETRYRWLY